MDLHKFENKPNVFFEPTPHTTDFFEIFIFEKASGKIELNGHSLEVKENTMFFISPFQTKSCKIDTSGIKGFHLVFQNDFLADFFNDILFTYRLQYFHNAQYPQYLHVENENYDVIRLALNEIISEIQAFQNDSPHIIRSLLYFSLSKLNRLFSKHYNISADTQSNAKIYTFKEALELNIRTLHSVEEYCNLLNVNRHQLNIMVKRHFGYTPKEIINNRLLHEIKMELRYSTKTITEIADTLHFSESNNLTRFFKKLEGVNPSRYREDYQNDSNY